MLKLIKRCASHNKAIPFELLTNGFDEIEKLKGKESRKAQKEIMSSIYKQVLNENKEELYKCYYLSIAKLWPDYAGIELGIGQESLLKIVSNISGVALKDSKKSSDLGTLIHSSRPNSFAYLTISEVFDTMREICLLKGPKSASLKEELFTQLLDKSERTESKYIVRLAQKQLKIGASEITMQAALAATFSDLYNHTHLEDQIKTAFNQCADYERVINSLINCQNDTTKLVQICGIRPGVPVSSMLASPVRNFEDILLRYKTIPFTCEYKYDGIRAQIHVLPDKTVQIFSRNRENLSDSFPEVCSFVAAHIPFECILDSELVPLDESTHKITIFQDIRNKNQAICVYAFDILYFNGESLLDLPYLERRKILHKHLPLIDSKIAYVDYANISNITEIEAFLDGSVERGLEGIMVKSLEEVYKPGNRSLFWLKLKKDYVYSGTSDSLDVVPIGAYYGVGKRSGVYGSFLLAIYDNHKDEYQTLCKIGTGFTDKMLSKIYNELKNLVIDSPQDNFKIAKHSPHVWFRPETVWEIRGSEFTLSPTHTGAWSYLGKKKGISVRFPRFVRVRKDKNPTEATSSEQIYTLYSQFIN